MRSKKGLGPLGSSVSVGCEFVAGGVSARVDIRTEMIKVKRTKISKREKGIGTDFIMEKMKELVVFFFLDESISVNAKHGELELN